MSVISNRKRCTQCNLIIKSGLYCNDCLEILKRSLIKEFNCSCCKTKAVLSMYVNDNDVGMMCCKNCIDEFNKLKSNNKVDQILKILLTVKEEEFVQEDYDKIIDRLYELTGDKTYFGEQWNHIKRWIFNKWPRDIGLYDD
jgi:hypothetical protein